MIFNSLAFLLFFPLITVAYWLIRYTVMGQRGVRWANILLLIGSYYFYMCWSVEYVTLLMFSTVITYLAGRGIGKAKTQQGKLAYVTLSIVLNFAILFLFKYLSFTAEMVVTVMHFCGIKMTVPDFGILLPVGISFYIFQAVGYTIDVYRGTTQPERNLLTYALFVSFFPQLVAGPIERSSNLLPQIRRGGIFSYENAVEGLKMMLWGYFMKLVLADRCAEYVDMVFDNPNFYGGGTYLIASIVFAFQIYGDFAGYSLIAIGVAKILGINLMKNFEQPYYAWSISNFWHRWHISLSTWFKDYLYIPLGGNRKGRWRTYRNLFLTFLVSGIWHGANLTFVAWGALHGVLMCIERALGWHRRKWHGVSQVLHTVITFIFVFLLFAIFRSKDISTAIQIIGGIFAHPGIPMIPIYILPYLLFSIGLVMAKDAVAAYNLPLSVSHCRYSWVRFSYMVMMVIVILGMGSLNGSKFIYFQF